jgi:hypothetical protein
MFLAQYKKTLAILNNEGVSFTISSDSDIYDKIYNDKYI